MNNRTKFLISGMATALCLFATNASADPLLYNQNITAIFGGGNPATGWTASNNTDANVQTAGRIKERTTGDTTNVNGVYTIGLGSIAQIEFSLNSNLSGSLFGAKSIADYDWVFGFDTDSSQGVNMAYVDLMTTFLDNSFGDNTTLSGQGVEPPANVTGMNVSQNSEKGSFGPMNYNLSADGTYDLQIIARNKGSSENLTNAAFQLVNGAGGAPVSSSVPDAGATAWLLGVAIVGFGFARRLNLIPSMGSAT